MPFDMTQLCPESYISLRKQGYQLTIALFGSQIDFFHKPFPSKNSCFWLILARMRFSTIRVFTIKVICLILARPVLYHNQALE